MTSAKRPGKKRPSPAAPAEPLSRQRIVAAALALVDDASLAGLSMRRLAQRLGCEAMSLYHHFPSKAHVLDALVEHAIASVEVPAPVADAATNRALLLRCMASYRAMAQRWPALFPLVAVHRLNTPVGVGFIESVVTLIGGIEPDREKCARLFRALGYYLTGACLDETSGYARGPSAAEPVDEAFIAAHCPNLMASAPYFQSAHWDATFRLGIDAMLDGYAPKRRR